MKTLELARSPESEGLIGKKVRENDCTQLIQPGTIITCGGKPTIIYGELATDTAELENEIKALKFSSSRRLTNVLPNGKATENEDTFHFGFVPPNPVFGTAAGPAKFNDREPKIYSMLMHLSEEIARLYRKHSPDKYKAQNAWLDEKVNAHWRLGGGGSPFTQGVINKSNALGYHYDRDNVPNGWSAMVYFKNAISGGNLIVPSLGVKFACADRAFMLFDGQNIMHGVTPICPRRFGAYRYSIVFYARKSMAGLGSFNEELARAQAVEMNKHKRKLSK